VVSVMATAAPLVGSSTVMFTAMEHWVSSFGTMAIASKIGGTAFVSVSAFGSTTVA
jgi:hypothetical protein